MELKRITVLWEEQWIDGLMQRTADVNRRLQRLKEEADRVSENKTLRLSEKRRLLREKHTAILKPVLVSLESLQRRTLTKGADSPHEVSFLRLYGPRIEAALEMLRNPKVQEDYDPLRVWQPFEDVLLNLRENSKRRLDLKHISPKLAGRQASAIPMPGLLAGTKAQVVTIQSFQSEVLILPTKTKPKKLALIGSDGRRYSYLFKGLEDLHLDERMMQFLDVVNATFSRARVGVGQRDAFRARNYNVIPLGEMQFPQDEVARGFPDEVVKDLFQDILRPLAAQGRRLHTPALQSGRELLVEELAWPRHRYRACGLRLFSHTFLPRQHLASLAGSVRLVLLALHKLPMLPLLEK